MRVTARYAASTMRAQRSCCALMDAPMAEAVRPPTISLLRLEAVEARTGLRKSAIYAGAQAGTFPKPVKLGPRAVAWSSWAIDCWIADRIRGGGPRAESDPPAPMPGANGGAQWVQKGDAATGAHQRADRQPHEATEAAISGTNSAEVSQ